MNPTEMLRIVDAIHRDKNIDKEIVFEGIEAALVSAAKKHYGEEADIVVNIDREDGSIRGTHDGAALDSGRNRRPHRRPDRQAGDDPEDPRGGARRPATTNTPSRSATMVSGSSSATKAAPPPCRSTNVEAILPRSEQIPGETHHVNERVRATVFEVRKSGSRVKVILSRTRPQLVQRLFEQEIPEIADGVIKISAHGPRAGLPLKVAVSSSDQRVDCVGACVGVRGNRIKNIVDELAGERIDIVRWDDDLEVLIPNALQPAEVEQVHPLQDARPGDRAGARGPAVAGHRPPRAERAAGQQALRLGHRDHDPGRAGRSRSTGRSAASAQLEGVNDGAGRAAGGGRLPELRRPVDHRARCADGDGRPERGSRST